MRCGRCASSLLELAVYGIVSRGGIVLVLSSSCRVMSFGSAVIELGDALKMKLLGRKLIHADD